MKIIRNSHFILNGIDERIISAPNNRDGDVKFTMGGMIEYATTLSVAHFEDLTGFYIDGLEPIANFDYQSEISRLKIALENMDMKLTDVSEGKIFANIDFATASNSRMSSSLSLSHNEDGYNLKVSKRNGYQGMGQKTFQGHNLPLLIDDALEQLASYISTRVQILSFVDRREELSRVISSEGFKCLFKNESVSDYFKKQDMPAGIVINQNGRYQTFVSFMSSDGTMLMSHETKDYANARNAVKKLNSYGYDALGRQNDVLNTKKLEEDLRNAMSNNYAPSWSDNNTAYFSTDQRGWFEISQIQLRDDDKFGTQYFFNWEYTFDETGNKLTREIDIDPRGGGNAHHILSQLCTFVREISDGLKNDSLEFDIDHRTLDEKAKYHVSRIAEFKKRRGWAEKIISNSKKDERWLDSAKKDIKGIDVRIAHHLEISKKIGEKMKLLEKEMKLDVEGLAYSY